MENACITFLGGGNMAASLIGGLIADGLPADRMTVSDPSAERREWLSARFGVAVHEDNRQAVAGADVVVLAVKPQVMRGLLAEVRDRICESNPLVVSIAAGLRTEALLRWLGCRPPLVRCMPNTPALVQSGVTALYAGEDVDEARRSLAESILRAVGITLWVEDEALLDAVTALSGSGPAYCFLLMEAMQAAGEALGLAPEQARLLTLQTVFGAAKMALESEEGPEVLRARVTSPGGTTERALAVFEEGGFRTLVQRAIEAAAERSRELADELGGA